MKMVRTYNELVRLSSFIDRYNYLKMGGVVGESSFGFDRYLNQGLYSSREWRSVRDQVILRDNGCDLGIEDRSIGRRIVIHHMNPISVDDIENRNPDIYDPKYLICVSLDTHNAIHFGDEKLLQKNPIERHPGDTCPWK